MSKRKQRQELPLDEKSEIFHKTDSCAKFITLSV